MASVGRYKFVFVEMYRPNSLTLKFGVKVMTTQKICSDFPIKRQTEYI